LSSLGFTALFACALLGNVVLKLWLAHRQVRHVAAHRDRVPGEFAQRIPLHAHQRAADYTMARVRLGIVDLALGAAVLLVLTLLGGLQWLHDVLVAALPEHPLVRGVTLVVGVAVLTGIVELPVSWYRQFRLEQRFGFNRMTMKLWLVDLVKGTLIGTLLGVPLLWLVLWLMERAGSAWWLWTWGVWVGFNLLVLVVYPTVIAPMFNRFEPLADGEVRRRIEALMQRCGFAAKGLFVMDGSRRSAHGNAYFTGLGRAKRIVFFDTLLARLDAAEIEAVLAHELGHFKRRHIVKRIVMGLLASLLGLWLLGWLTRQPWFFQGLGVTPDPAMQSACALVLFFLVLPIFTFVLQPLTSWMSRRHEFEADAFAASQTRAHHLVDALVKLYEDNASTLTPDPVHSAFYDSHPPASQRIARLNRFADALPMQRSPA
jgi:STE24 endopeptidase